MTIPYYSSLLLPQCGSGCKGGPSRHHHLLFFISSLYSLFYSYSYRSFVLLCFIMRSAAHMAMAAFKESKVKVVHPDLILLKYSFGFRLPFFIFIYNYPIFHTKKSPLVALGWVQCGTHGDGGVPREKATILPHRTIYHIIIFIYLCAVPSRMPVPPVSVNDFGSLCAQCGAHRHGGVLREQGGVVQPYLYHSLSFIFLLYASFFSF